MINIPGSGNHLEDMYDQRLMDEQKERGMERTLFVGDIVIAKVRGLMGNPGGAKGVVYEEYDIGDGPGVSIIFENGQYDGFSPKDQERMVLKVGFHKWTSDYKFNNVIELGQDFDEGYWESAFNE